MFNMLSKTHSLQQSSQRSLFLDACGRRNSVFPGSLRLMIAL